MSRYTLQVVVPFFKSTKKDDQLAEALDSIATIHAGSVVESCDISTKAYQRFVNVFNCESSLEREVEWLREKFPDSRFTLKEFMST